MSRLLGPRDGEGLDRWASSGRPPGESPTVEALFGRFLGDARVPGHPRAGWADLAEGGASPARAGTLEALADLNPLAYHTARLSDGAPILTPADYARLYRALTGAEEAGVPTAAAFAGLIGRPGEPSAPDEAAAWPALGEGVPDGASGWSEFTQDEVAVARVDDQDNDPWGEGKPLAAAPGTVRILTLDEQAAVMLAVYGPNPVLVELGLWDAA